MSSGFTSYGVATMLRSLFTTDVATVPAFAEFAACLTVPVMNATGDQLVEPPASAGYSRASLSMTADSWGVSDFGEIYNIVDMPLGTPSQQWGPLYGWALVDPGTTECIVVGELIDPLDPVVGMEISVPPSALVIGLYG